MRNDKFVDGAEFSVTMFAEGDARETEILARRRREHLGGTVGNFVDGLRRVVNRLGRVASAVEFAVGRHNARSYGRNFTRRTSLRGQIFFAQNNFRLARRPARRNFPSRRKNISAQVGTHARRRTFACADNFGGLAQRFPAASDFAARDRRARDDFVDGISVRAAENVRVDVAGNFFCDGDSFGVA